MFKPHIIIDNYELDVFISDHNFVTDGFNKYFAVHYASDGSCICGYTITNWKKLLDKLLTFNSRKNYNLQDLIEYAVWSGDVYEEAPPLLSFKSNILKSLGIIDLKTVNHFIDLADEITLYSEL